MNKTLYTCIIEELNEREAFIQVYWAYAHHLGEAIWLMLNAARVNGLTNPVPRECDPYDLENLSMDVVPHSKAEVFWSENRDYFAPEPVFELPEGIIGSCLEENHDVDELSRGYTQCTDKQGVFYLDVNVDAGNLFPLYSTLLHTHDSYKVFWYVLHGHWEKSSQDLYLVNEKFNTAAKISDHLTATPLNSISNGFVTLTAYREQGATNLTITDHKMITISSFSKEDIKQYTRSLEDAGYRKKSKMLCIDDGMHHWHYRLPGSLSRKDLTQILKESGFSDWQS